MNALATALVAAQAKMPAVDKTGRSNFGAHITLDHLIATTRPHLQKHGLTILQFPAVLETGQPALRTVLLHESGESLQADAPLFLGEKHNMQELGKALTYARRQGWSAVLGISTEDDDDADSISLPQKGSKPAASPSAAGGTPKAPAPSSPGAAGAPLPTETQMVEYGKLLDAWKKLSPVFDRERAVALALDKDGPWVIRASRRLQENIDREIEARKKAA